MREALCRLERDGFVRPEDGGAFAVAPLSEIEVREGYPVVILLEGLAVRTHAGVPARGRRAPARDQRGDGRRAHATRWRPPRTTGSSTRSSCATAATTSCSRTLRPLKRLLLRYEYHYMSARDFVSRSVHQHEAIIEALERGDREAASALVEDNFRDSMPGILEQL